MRFRATLGLFISALLLFSEQLFAANDPNEANSCKVSLSIFITAKGVPRSAKILEEHGNLPCSQKVADAVRDAALTMTFHPTLENGKPVPGYITVPFWVN
jgi:hypothetical protein